MSGHRPPGAPDLVTFLIVKDPQVTLDLAQGVLGATMKKPPLMRGNGRIWHLEIHVGDSMIITSGAEGDFEVPGFVYGFVPDADAAFARALDIGAEAVMPAQDQFYGIRDCGVRDANGTLWWFGTHREEVAPDELQRRAIEHEKTR